MAFNFFEMENIKEENLEKKLFILVSHQPKSLEEHPFTQVLKKLKEKLPEPKFTIVVVEIVHGTPESHPQNTEKVDNCEFIRFWYSTDIRAFRTKYNEEQRRRLETIVSDLDLFDIYEEE